MGLVQHASGTATSGTTTTATFGSNTGSGNLLIAGASSKGLTTLSVSGVALTGSSDTFSSAISATQTNTDAEIWHDDSSSSGHTATVVTWSGSVTDAGHDAYEWTGQAATPLDKTSGSVSGSGTSWSSGTTATLSQSAEVAFGVVVNIGSATITGPGGSWTNETGLTNGTWRHLSGFQQVSVTTGLAYSGTLSASVNYAAVIATFKLSVPSVNLTTAQVTVAANALTPAVALNLTTAGLTVAANALSPAASLPLTTAQIKIGANPLNPLGFVNLTKTTIGSSYGTPGPVSVSPGNTDGNLLVCLAAWDTVALTTSGGPAVPVAAVTDDAENWWRLAADSGNAVPGCRTAIWVCSNARPVQRWLSCCPQGEYTSLWYVVLELFSPFANYWPLIDFHVPASNRSASTLNAGGTAGVADYCFSIGAVGNAGTSITAPGGGWNAAASGSVGGASPDSVAASTVWGKFSAGAVATTWNYGAAGQVAACTIGLTQAQNLPAQVNPGIPKLVLEAALGASPGDSTTAILDTSYTDLSVRLFGPAGQTQVSISGGQQYELSQPESGTMTAWMNNQDGALTPGYLSSPYYPNIKPGVPVRLSCYHLGRRYGLWAGFVERWPQEWPDMPQWGWSPMVATDVVGVSSSANLPSAVQGEIWCDQPYLCLPFGEQYTTSQNTVNGASKTPAGADGQVAVNTARNNLRNATYFGRPGVAQSTSGVVTGQSMGFLGDSGTGMGTSGYSGLLLDQDAGPGVQYGLDSGMPSLAASGAGEATIEMWIIVPSVTAPVSGEFVQLWALYTPPVLQAGVTNIAIGQFLAGGLQVAPAGSNNLFWLQVNWNNTVYSIGAANVVLGSLNHVVIGLNTTTGNVEFYLNGVLITPAPTGMPSSASFNGLTFGPQTLGAGAVGTVANTALANYSMAYGTFYPYRLDASRIAAHYASGITGFQGDTILQRAGRYVGWGGLNVGLGGSNLGITDHIQLGPAYSTAGAPLASALNADALSSGAIWYANSTGNLVILGRNALYGQAPALVFGDNYPAEIPFLPDSSFDFDNTYIKNSAQATLTQGPNSMAAPLVRDPTSVSEYFQRGPLAQSISAGTTQDATDLAAWSLAKYKEPSLRVRTLVVQAARKPTVLPQLLANGLQTVATVNRRPLSGASYSLPVRIGKRQLDIGPGKWDYTYQMYPYVLEQAALEPDTPGFSTLGSGAIVR